MLAELYDFEADFVASLRCVPMAVRFKLDACGIKLTLRQWSRLTREDRAGLLHRECGDPVRVAAYGEHLAALVLARAGEVAKPLPEPADQRWTDLGAPPPEVVAQAQVAGLAPPTAEAWAGLTDLRRFVLIKLSRDSHDNVNFGPAMQEFGLAPRSTD